MNFVEQAAYATEKAKEYVSSAGEALVKARLVVGGDSQFFSTIPKVDEMRRALSSDSIYEKRDTMKRIIAQMCKGNNMKHLFPDVVKNIHDPSIELRKLIYLFVVHYAEDCPDEALLSISAFQKDLVHSSMHVRSLALRMLCSLRIPSIGPVMMVAIQKGAQDVAGLVRKTAAIALVQLYSLAPEQMDLRSAKTVLSELLSDRSGDVVGAAAMAYCRLCAEDVALLHPVFVNLCNQLHTMEETGQVFVLKALLRYARLNFQLEPPKTEKLKSTEKTDLPSSSSSTTSSSTSDNEENSLNNQETLDSDLLFLLKSVKRLLRSMSSAVVVGACNILYFCAPTHYCEDCVKPLVRIVSCGNSGVRSIVLVTICSFILGKNCDFRRYYKHFYLAPEDANDVYRLKLSILGRLIDSTNAEDIFNEFKAYTRSQNPNVVVEALQGLKLIASTQPDYSPRVARLLQPLFSDSDPNIVSDSISLLRLLVMQTKENEVITKYVYRLMNQVMKREITASVAVRSVLWLVGENVSVHPVIAGGAPDCFRVFLSRFPSLSTAVKEEVLLLGCKIWFFLEGSGELAERFKELYFFSLRYATYDDNYTIRDLGRFLENTKERGSPSFELIKKSLLSEKPPPHYTEPFSDRLSFELDSLSHYFGSPMFHYKPVPEWTQTPSSRALRHPLEESFSRPANRTVPSSSSSHSFYSEVTESEEEEETELEEEKSVSESRDGEEKSESNSDNSEEDDSSDSESDVPVKKPPRPTAPKIKITVHQK